MADKEEELSIAIPKYPAIFDKINKDVHPKDAFPIIAPTLHRTKTTPCSTKRQNRHLVQLKGVVKHPGLTHLLGRQGKRV